MGELHTYLRIVTQKKHKPALIPLSKKTLGLLPKKRKNSDFVFNLAGSTRTKVSRFKKMVEIRKRTFY